MHLDVKDTPELMHMILSTKYDISEFRVMLIEVDIIKVRRKKKAIVLTVCESIPTRAQYLFALLRSGSVHVVIGDTPIYDVDPSTVYAFNKTTPETSTDEKKNYDCFRIELILLP